jgi:hypothetical protein
LFLGEHIYNQARTFFQKNLWFCFRMRLLPRQFVTGFKIPKNFSLFFFFAGGRISEKNERKILRILNFAQAKAEAARYIKVGCAGPIPTHPRTTHYSLYYSRVIRSAHSGNLPP